MLMPQDNGLVQDRNSEISDIAEQRPEFGDLSRLIDSFIKH